MKLIRNLLALIGLAAIITLAVAYARMAPKLSEFDEGFIDVYADFAERLLDTGDPGIAMMWAVPVADGLAPEEVIESMKSLATSRNLLFVGESPFYRQIKAITGEDYRYVNFLSFCDAQIGKRMLEHQDHYSGFMPCRIALVEGRDGRLWLYSMNMDMMIQGGKRLPDDLRADANRVRDSIRAIMEGAAVGEF